MAGEFVHGAWVEYPENTPSDDTVLVRNMLEISMDRIMDMSDRVNTIEKYLGEVQATVNSEELVCVEFDRWGEIKRIIEVSFVVSLITAIIVCNIL